MVERTFSYYTCICRYILVNIYYYIPVSLMYIDIYCIDKARNTPIEAIDPPSIFGIESRLSSITSVQLHHFIKQQRFNK